MGSRVALFVFPLRSVTCLPAPTPLSKKWRCVSAQHFTLTRLTVCTDGSDKSLSSVKCCHGFGRAETPFLGCTVTGTGWVFFLHPPPPLPLHATLLRCGSVPRPCGAASCQPTFSHNPCTIACGGCAESTAFSPHYLTHE